MCKKKCKILINSYFYRIVKRIKYQNYHFMNVSTKYNPGNVEGKWYQYWMDHGFFKSVPDEDREPYTIVIPPPNVTGVLHMGHMLNNTIQDILIRRARMKGKNALWLPGTDHASIATEARVVAKLRNEGLNKADTGRDGFLKHAWEWTEKHGGIILEQLKKLGASCDWDRTKFTMDPELSESVIKVFVDLYNKGYIYRGVRMVNWDPEAKTAVSDEEVIYKEVSSGLFYIKYRLVGDKSKFLTIATTRPETILGDTAVCINPEDKRYKNFVGQKVYVPLVNRPVPVIEDDYVDMEFGTGCLKITPAHDLNDYEIGQRHKLPTIDIFNDDGTMNENAELFIGEDRFDVRDKIVPELEKDGVLVKKEQYVNKVGYSERTDAVIEPKLSMQWFVKMKELSKPALENVLNDQIRIVPPKFKNTYRHWMENVKDWCISRQLWWGHRIPVYYIRNTDEYVVAENVHTALEIAREITGKDFLKLHDLEQDEDVLDTWFSSWLWPISVFDGIRNPDNPDINYYYPTNDLVTAPEILFFWVARMIIAGYEYKNDKPFQNVYLTGIVRDAKRRKMSKSLGNSPDPLELIKKYSADGVRVGMLLCSPAGNDLLFDESLPEQGRNFGNKIWNAFRLINSWDIAEDLKQPDHSLEGIKWFSEKLKQGIVEIEDNFKKYRISDALMTLYRLFWDDFSSWYLEIIKPAYQQPVDPETYETTIIFFDQLLRLLHPFMPFITEEIWQLLRERKDGESIMVSKFPEIENFDEKVLEHFDHLKEIIVNIRNVRKERNIAMKTSLSFFIKKGKKQHDNLLEASLKKLGNLQEVAYTNEKKDDAISFVIKSTEYFIPVGDIIDPQEEKNKLLNELEYTRGFLNSVLKKLNNERFVQNAPEKVVAMEQKKKEDAEAKIKILEEKIAGLQ